MLERRGGGYCLELGDAVLDARSFEALVDDAAAAGDVERAAALATEALELWRGPALSGVRLQRDGEAERGRLEDLRLRAIEIRGDAQLELGRHLELVTELRRLVDEHPYRERFVAQLMVALYRSGRQADALATYERTRRRLVDDLGVQPGPELQRLSGEIVRQEGRLSTPARVAARTTGRRGAAVALVLALAAAAVSAALVFGGGGGSAAAAGTRVALVLPRAAEAGREDAFVTPFVDGLRRAASVYDVDAETLVLEPINPSTRAVKRTVERLRAGRFDLVLVAGFASSAFRLRRFLGRLSAMRVVYIDASLRRTPFEWPRNATGVGFADADSGYLAGYLSGLVTARRAPLQHRRPVVSVVAGIPTPSVMALVRSFIRGVQEARPGVKTRVDYAWSFADQSICERLANTQIDHGSTVIFAAASTCGLGALAAAGVRGVWGVGSDADLSYLGSHILVSTVKRYDRAVELAVRWFLEGTLPSGDVVLGLDDDAVGIAGISPEVDSAVRRKMARVEAALRAAPHS
jgi:basic membrane lipoprotein Med (substrate-binding protein (PBP1-ABC) superfamily)